MEPTAFTAFAEFLKATGPYGLYVSWNQRRPPLRRGRGEPWRSIPTRSGGTTFLE